MARDRIIYQSEALYVSKHINSTEIEDHVQLRRVQNANYGFNIIKEDVNEAGQLSRIDALALTSPTVSLDFSYYPTDGYNEKALGFYVQNNALGNNQEINFVSGHIGTSSGQNFYIITAGEGVDLNITQGNSTLSGRSTIAIGNGFLSSYLFTASVGDFPISSVEIEGLNIRSSIILSEIGSGINARTGNFVSSPTVNPTIGCELSIISAIPNPCEAIGSNYISALRPGDITLSFGQYANKSALGSPISILEGIDGINVQNVLIAIPLNRTPIERLGSRFAFTQAIDFPIIATLDVSAILNETQAKSLAKMLDDNSRKEISLKIKKAGSEKDALIFKFKGSQLQSESFSSSIGSNKVVDLIFETEIGGPTDMNNGVYVSGSYTDILNGQWGYQDITDSINLLNSIEDINNYIESNSNSIITSASDEQIYSLGLQIPMIDAGEDNGTLSNNFLDGNLDN